MKRFILPLVLLSLAACGVDGEPVAPAEAEATSTGISLTGSASLGVGGTL
ncbi:hypothetical protein JANAI62_06800 [Jannaschia pagri]|uniref:Argininosuccinate lyase n=1 Tax=Jannaschia pagri TaxID=2829797 RepID=A0ABQ4NI08_9RHOB|nr:MULTISPECIES: argininosuccinate lyase [unclassified Jannaschia]GIT89836.1 hypothetical protein JANAI61_02940 [Jannaschia sp. AI_61]GIT94057.1 hypothetical protein JANAI62_06800 [Jannaschia sp. AI_62]